MSTVNPVQLVKKIELNQRLCELTPVLFAMVVFRLGDVEQFLPSSEVSLALRAMELVKHMNAVSEETNLNFDTLSDFDTFTSDTESVSGKGVREIKGREDLLG